MSHEDIEYRVLARGSVGRWNATVVWRVGTMSWRRFRFRSSFEAEDAQLRKAVEAEASPIRAVLRSRHRFWATSRIWIHGPSDTACEAFIDWLTETAPKRFRRAAREARDHYPAPEIRRGDVGDGRATVGRGQRQRKELTADGGFDLNIFLPPRLSDREEPDFRNQLRQKITAAIEVAHLKNCLSKNSGSA